ncbi:PLP-dependent aspartate aminotransferase family protein [Methylocapsa sp. S129]|uniref:trans-sulfuration enzyme family protein n=1 Tax=Methylocapsa sp. S129 TaxID=1641869 RepID=UPI00131C4859|nr:aminotransferase class I/II-fold pyridoxal phosphate-dependent enzyme [Methylocapsa sp. S129]
MEDKAEWSARTLAAQALGRIDEKTRAIVPPLHVATTFIRDPDNLYRSGNIYGRADNETVREGEAIVAALEGAPSALLFGSGMSAAIALFLGLGPGAHVVAPKVMYWSLRNWLVNEAPAHGVAVDLADADDLNAIAAAIKPGRTKLIWLETPSNPLWGVSDIAGAARLAHGVGAKLAVDSTCATPVFTKPLALGADVVMHSATKYLNGHSDVLAGALAFASDDSLAARIRQIRAAHGMILGPFEAYLLIRGMRTLDLRVRAAAASAFELAQRLSNHSAVSAVLYPGLPHHPNHEIARRQMVGGFGGMLSVRVRDGEAAAIATAARVRLWKRATSLGGVEALIEHRASVEGPTSPCPPDLLRLSAGIEDVEDLWRDLDQALRP